MESIILKEVEALSDIFSIAISKSCVGEFSFFFGFISLKLGKLLRPVYFKKYLCKLTMLCQGEARGAKSKHQIHIKIEL
jgi:hypothetical protein